MRTFKIADSMFSPWGKTFWLGAANKNRTPENFEWEICNTEHVQEARFVSQSHIQFAAGENQIAVLLESFFLHPKNYIQALEKPFKYVLTHNQYFARNNENWLWFPHGGSWVDFDAWKIYPKTKDVSILLSPKRQLRGHKLFHEVVEKYGAEFDDIYGLDRYVENKVEALAPYRFAVIIEAEREEGFFTEKLIDCFSCGTVPIYWGCPNISSFFDGRGIIQVENLDQIGSYLRFLCEEDYAQRMEGVQANFQIAARYRCAEDWIFTHYPFLFED